MTITPEKRNSLIKLGLITAAVMIAFWFILIRPVQAKVSQRNTVIEDLTKKIADKNDVIKRGGQIKERLDETTRQLRRVEEQMVAGDTYLWIIKTLGDFETPERLEFTKYDPPRIIQPVTGGNLPYSTASYSVTGTAAYHDFGRFLARLENIYPHIRIHRIDMEPAAIGFSSDEKLSFLIELHVLMKPGTETKTSPRS